MQCGNLERKADGRSETRSSVYIAGIVTWSLRSIPAKIRNLSSGGALLEADALPPLGTNVRVVRGSLFTDGVVAWTASGRCGVRFDNPVIIKQWISPSSNNQQKRVDDTVAYLKGLGPHEPSRPELERVASSTPATPRELASDLRELRRLVDEIGSELMNDDDIISRYPVTLQNFDLVAQSIEAIADVFSNGSSHRTSAERLESLRASRTEALNRRPEASV